MTTQPFIVSPQDYPRALSVLGVQITVLAPNTPRKVTKSRCRKARKAWDRRRTSTTGTRVSSS